CARGLVKGYNVMDYW
nr:immunoglobulin heavy chain junction region [Mus musculus]